MLFPIFILEGCVSGGGFLHINKPVCVGVCVYSAVLVDRACFYKSVHRGLGIILVVV